VISFVNQLRQEAKRQTRGSGADGCAAPGMRGKIGDQEQLVSRESPFSEGYSHRGTNNWLDVVSWEISGPGEAASSTTPVLINGKTITRSSSIEDGFDRLPLAANLSLDCVSGRRWAWERLVVLIAVIFRKRRANPRLRERSNAAFSTAGSPRLHAIRICQQLTSLPF